MAQYHEAPSDDRKELFLLEYRDKIRNIFHRLDAPKPYIEAEEDDRSLDNEFYALYRSFLQSGQHDQPPASNGEAHKSTAASQQSSPLGPRKYTEDSLSGGSEDQEDEYAGTFGGQTRGPGGMSWYNGESYLGWTDKARPPFQLIKPQEKERIYHEVQPTLRTRHRQHSGNREDEEDSAHVRSTSTRTRPLLFSRLKTYGREKDRERQRVSQGIRACALKVGYVGVQPQKAYSSHEKNNYLSTIRQRERYAQHREQEVRRMKELRQKESEFDRRRRESVRELLSTQKHRQEKQSFSVLLAQQRQAKQELERRETLQRKIEGRSKSSSRHDNAVAARSKPKLSSHRSQPAKNATRSGSSGKRPAVDYIRSTAAKASTIQPQPPHKPVPGWTAKTRGTPPNEAAPSRPTPARRAGEPAAKESRKPRKSWGSPIKLVDTISRPRDVKAARIHRDIDRDEDIGAAEGLPLSSGDGRLRLDDPGDRGSLNSDLFGTNYVDSILTQRKDVVQKQLVSLALEPPASGLAGNAEESVMLEDLPIDSQELKAVEALILLQSQGSTRRYKCSRVLKIYNPDRSGVLCDLLQDPDANLRLVFFGAAPSVLTEVVNSGDLPHLTEFGNSIAVADQQFIESRHNAAKSGEFPIFYTWRVMLCVANLGQLYYAPWTRTEFEENYDFDKVKRDWRANGYDTAVFNGNDLVPRSEDVRSMCEQLFVPLSSRVSEEAVPVYLVEYTARLYDD